MHTSSCDMSVSPAGGTELTVLARDYGAGASDTEGSHHEHRVRRSEWWHSSAVIVGEVMGTGVLSLPYACSRLGWVCGISASIGFGCAAFYSGTLLAYLKNYLYPGATSFADLSFSIGGRRFGIFTRVVLCAGWALILPYYLVACSSALAAAIPSAGLCYWHWSLVVMVLMAPLLQLRSLHGLSYLSAASTAAIIIALALLIPGLISSRPTTTVTSWGLPVGEDFFSVYR